MPPKTTDAAVAAATKDTNFLATCFMNLKTKPQVDNAAVAAKLSMSVGGVGNKLRPIIKAMEDAGALWTTDQSASPTPARGTKATNNTAENGFKDGDGGEEGDAAGPVTPKPIAKARAKQPAKTPTSSTKRCRGVKDSVVDGGESPTENATRQKKAKASHSTVTEEQDEVDKQIKKDPETANPENGTLEDGTEVKGDVTGIKSEVEHD